MWDKLPKLRTVVSVLIYGLLLAGGYAGYVILHRPDFFPVQQIRLTTPLRNVQTATVLKLVRQSLQGNFFTADIVFLRQSLEKLPWVRRVAVSRSFPGQLTIKLATYQALAHWNKHALISGEGEVFYVPDAYQQNLPHFTAPDGTEKEVIAGYVALNKQLAAQKLRITQLTLSPRHAWQIRLDNDMVLELGRENMQQRLAKFIAVYPYTLAVSRNTVKQVDLRYRNGFAVQQ